MGFSIKISTAKSRKADRWAEAEVLWDDFARKCAKPKRTSETAAEYAAMSRDERSERKDAGGFVGGTLRDGVRKRGHCVERSLLTLDIDHAEITPDAVWSSFTSQWEGTAGLMYSTHSHTPEMPRLRLVVPLLSPLSREYYEPAARALADTLGIGIFDSTTFDPERLFFWPSCPKDGEFVFRRSGGEPLDPADLLGVYSDPLDRSEWPYSDDDDAPEPVRREAAAAAERPDRKRGVVGAFCRAFPIWQAIETFLPDIYAPVPHAKSRYTYTGGTSSGGLVTYEGLWAYSFHETDPARGRLLNAFDLVRVHRYGWLDKGRECPDIAKAESFKAMAAFAAERPEVVKETLREDFGGVSVPDIQPNGETPAEAAKTPGNGGSRELTEEEERLIGKIAEIKAKIKAKLDKKKDNTPASTIRNAEIVLTEDPRVAGKIALNLFTEGETAKDGLPWQREGEQWKDSDDSCLRAWLESEYGLTGKDKIYDAVAKVMSENRYHPVRDYLGGLKWDGKERLSKMVIDYIGADDCPLTREMTKKHFTAAVARVFEPGIKYDQALILAGPEGVGKSTLLRIMGGKWFNDSIFTTEGKEGMDMLRGSWIIELAELSAMKRADVEPLKSFLSSQSDRYRAPYGRRQTEHPRQCVFCGTTNETYFLKGDTGNRRFWVIPVTGNKREDIAKSWMEALANDRDQLWAEAVHYYRKGEPLTLPAEMEKDARERQREHNDTYDDPMFGMIDGFLDMPLPKDWDDMNEYRRKEYVRDVKARNDNDIDKDNTHTRVRVCAMEILRECLDLPKSKDDPYTCRKITKYLEEKDGWKRGPMSRHVQKLYGLQKCFERDDDDEKPSGNLDNKSDGKQTGKAAESVNDEKSAIVNSGSSFTPLQQRFVNGVPVVNDVNNLTIPLIVDSGDPDFW